MEKFSPTLAKKERILVLNKIDLLPWQELEELEAKLQKELKWGGPIFKIAAINKQGCDELCNHLMKSIELHRGKMVRDDGYKTNENLVQEISAEIGDCLWYISVLADDIGCKLSDIANTNLIKLENRKKKGTIKGSGDKR